MNRTIVFLLVSLLTACAPSPVRINDGRDPAEGELALLSRKIDEIHHRLSVIQLMVDNHERSVRDLEKRTDREKERKPPGPAEVRKSSPAPSEGRETGPMAASLYNQAMSAYLANDFLKASSLFQSISERNPDHELAGNALYWHGECLYAQKSFPEALAVFKKVLDRYPKGTKVPDSLLKIGYVYLALEDAANARIYLGRAASVYPASPAGIKAEEKLRIIQK
jgi:tol-pal system protein YbgF